MLTRTVTLPIVAALPASRSASCSTCESCSRPAPSLRLTWPDATFLLCRSCVPTELLPEGTVLPVEAVLSTPSPSPAPGQPQPAVDSFQPVDVRASTSLL